MRIGITSEGDRAEILEAKLRELEYKGCAIIVCASRTRAWFERIVNDLRQSSYEVDWIEKEKEGTTKVEQDAEKVVPYQQHRITPLSLFATDIGQ